MSNLDLVQQETIALTANQIYKNLPNSDEKSMNELNIELLDAWREVFEEDKVQVLEVCC